MRRVLLVLWIGLLAAPVFAQGAKGLDDAWMKAAKAGDVEGLVKLYAPDAVTYMPDEMKAKGPAEIRESFKKFLGASTVREMTLTPAYSTPSGNLAVTSGSFSMTVEPKGGGAAQTMEGRYTSVAVKKNGKWMYVVDHASVPMPPPEAAPK
ncbi:MAG TPA: SgcJ/EcaC family oxidoreductase [Thermoanaerobaculia bacterium]|nr:SgcJ/EcaC family oxidoreductase [Thermoanaerobaculia bacterium]